MRVDMIYSFEDIDTEYVKTSRMNGGQDARRLADRARPARRRARSRRGSTRRYKARTSKHFLALAPANLKVGSLMTDLEKGRARMKRGLPGVKRAGEGCS